MSNDLPLTTAPSLAAASKREPRRLALRCLKLLLLAVVLYFVGRTLVRDFRKIPWHQTSVSFPYLLLSLLVLLLARLMNALTVVRLLAALGSPSPPARVVPIIWIASLGRYIPGKMAVVGGAMVMLRNLGVRVPVAAAALFLSGAMMILLGIITSTPLLYTTTVRQRLPSGPVLSGILLVVGILCLFPPVFLRLANLGLRTLKREPLPAQMSRGHFWTALATTTIRNLCLGLGLYCCARAVHPVALSQYPLSLASAGLASVAGFLAVFAPAGLGVHEGIYLITMAPVLGPKAALMVLLFRALHVLADAVAGAIASVMLKQVK